MFVNSSKILELFSRKSMANMHLTQSKIKKFGFVLLKYFSYCISEK